MSKKPKVKIPRYGWQHGVNNLFRVFRSFAELCLKQNADWVDNPKWCKRFKIIRKFKRDALEAFIVIQRKWGKYDIN